jgi:hypothetical protein
MSVPPDPVDRLDELLPYVYRLRDTAYGEPLRALLRVITEQVDVVEADIRQLYDNWFIETCQPWVLPYLGDLIGYQPLHELAAAEPDGTVAGGGLERVLVPRRDAAHTLGNRRRKGTLALLEEIAAEVAGWPARAVEFRGRLALTQPVRLLGDGVAADRRRLRHGRTVDLRDGDALERVDGAFDELAHTVSVGRVTSSRTVRRYNVPSVGLFVWRLQPFRLTRAPANCIDRARGRYTFSILGNDVPLVTRPIAEPEPTHIADEMNVPAFIRRRAFDDRTPDYYGAARSLFIWRDADRRPVPLGQIVAADLSRWAYRPRGQEVAVDPRLGRIVFAPRTAPEAGVWVSYGYAFSARMGGGEYERPLEPLRRRPLYRVSSEPGRERGLMDAVRQWQEDKRRDPGHRRAVIEIADSGVYEEPIEIDLAPQDRLEIRAAQGRRPVIRLLNWYSNRPDSMQVRGIRLTEEHCDGGGEAANGGAPRLLLDGLLVTGRGIRVSGLVGQVALRHCTLVPGWSIGEDCEPDSEGEPSLDLADTAADVVVEHSITGLVRINDNEVDSDPIRVTVADSVLDATSPHLHAFSGPDGGPAGARMTIARATVLGRMCVQLLDLAEDCLFTARLEVSRRGHGCVRFCYVPPGSRTPRRHHCQPDLVMAAARERAERHRLDPGDAAAAVARERDRVQPLVDSRRYGRPEFARLSLASVPEIARGAHDESEVGAFHDLFDPQRDVNLRTRLDQFTPAGTDAGVLHVT